MEETKELVTGFRRRFSKALAFIMAVCMICTCIPQTARAASEPAAAEDIKLQAEGRTFVHPGMLHTAESFAMMKANVEGEVQPAYDTWNSLKSNGFSAADWQGRPLETVVRGGTGDNVAQFYIDIRRAYQTALVWKIGGSESHGEAACRILNKWTSTMTALQGNADRFLAAGIHGYELANAAEIMRDYPGFDKEGMDKLLLDVFYPMNDDFLRNHNTAHFGNYWANWDLCNIASMMAIGIFTDRADIYEQAVDYYKTGIGMGSLYNAMPYVYEEGLAQWQESGRDQGHTTLGIALCGPICEMAWNQGDDLYSLSDNRFLKGAEYVAKYNNMEDVPYEPYERYAGQTGKSEWGDVISNAGRPAMRPIYSLVYNHYVNRMGLEAPNIEKALKAEDGSWKLELESSKMDEMGWQTLTFAGTGKRTEAKKTQGVFADGVYRIRSVRTNKTLVADEEGTLSSARRGMTRSEWWRFENTGDGEYTITNTVTGQVLQTGDETYSNGTHFATGQETGALNQRFAIVPNDTGDYRIISSINDFAVDVYNGQGEDTTPVIQWKYNGGSGQKWLIETKADAKKTDTWTQADFTFDDEATGFSCETAKAQGTYTLTDSFSAENGKALYLDGSAGQYLTITDKDGGSLLTGAKELTISFEAKADRTDTNWAFYAAPDANAQTLQKEKYIGVMLNNGKVTAERYNNNGSRPENVNAEAGSDWVRVDVVMNPAATELYINGEKVSVVNGGYALNDILGDSSIIQIGKANWGDGEYYKGWIDNLSIRTVAMSEEDVKSLAAGEEIKEPVYEEILAQFDFDDETDGFRSENAKAEGSHTLQDSHHRQAGKALYLDGSAGQYLTVTDINGNSLLTGTDELTISFESKPDRNDTNWLFYAAPDEARQNWQKERYIGIMQNTGTITAERYLNNGARPQNPSYNAGSDWVHVDVVLRTDKTEIYVNGVKQAEAASNYALSDILGDNSILQIGKANWNTGEFYKGWMDNLTIRNYAMNTGEIKEEADKFLNLPNIPEVLADFNFDADGSYFDGGNAKAVGIYTLEDHGTGKALRLNGNNQFLTVTDKNDKSLLTGIDEMTVSYQIKPENSKTNWGFFAAPNTDEQKYQKEHYVGIADISGTTSAERYNNNGARPAVARAETGYDGWYYVTVVYTEDATSLYINGERVSEEASTYALTDILGENSILYIGKSTWVNGEYATALIDNYKIVSKALTAEEVKAEAAKYVEKDPEPVEADKTALKAAIDVKVDAEDTYTAESWKVYKDALSAANTAYNKKDATQAEVDVAAKALTDATAKLAKKPQEPKRPFVDVDRETGSWYYDAVYYNYDREIMNGVNPTHFEPLSNLARAQFAVILHNMEGKPAVSYEPKFKDVEDEQWYTDAILWASSKGIVTGYTDGSERFGWGDKILREQMAVMMYRYAKNFKKYDTNEAADFENFTDAAQVSDYAKEAMKWAVGTGIITGKDNGTRLDPQGNASRAECAIIIQRFLEKYEE